VKHSLLARGGWRLMLALLVLPLMLMTGCATVGGPQVKQSAGQKLDPWENWNRKVFAFNEGLDEHVLKPVATTYRKLTPSFLRTGISNFFNNAEDAWSAVNHFLQGKGESGMQMLVRFNTNTFFGLGGILDVASEAGIERQPEDFGQTLGKWGFGAGAYIVWPVLGPSSVRDSAALPLDRTMTSPAPLFKPEVAQWEVLGLQLVNTRAGLLDASRVIDDIALDKYTFLRDAYLARRRSLVYDGNPPDSSPRDDAEDQPPAAPAAPASAPQ
jgi:phospholipid-binding lipoprotein MlaA